MTHVRASVVLLTYNQEAFVQEALQSLLDQDIDDLEIVVSDDASKDGTWKIVLQITNQYAGTKRIVLNRNEQNIGLVANYFKAFSLTQGDVIFTAAGDDVSLPERCRACIDYWVAQGCKPDLIAADGYDMGLDGHIFGVKKTDQLQNWDSHRWTEKRPFIFGASHMMTRRILSFGSLDSRLLYEDQCLLFRALLMGGSARLSTPLVKHRRGGISQQSKNYNYEVKKENLLKSARHGLLECLQMRGEALILSKSTVILDCLAQQYKTEQFFCDMLCAKKLFTRLRLLYATTNVSWEKKLRYFQFVTFPRFHRSLMWLKKIFKRKQ